MFFLFVYYFNIYIPSLFCSLLLPPPSLPFYLRKGTVPGGHLHTKKKERKISNEKRGGERGEERGKRKGKGEREGKRRKDSTRRGGGVGDERG